MFKELLRYVLPKEIVESFDLVDLQEKEKILHLYLDEYNKVPEEYKALSLLPNGFYEESTLKDFPLRDKKVILHIRRRRWIDCQGKSYSHVWDLTADRDTLFERICDFFKRSFWIPTRFQPNLLKSIIM